MSSYRKLVYHLIIRTKNSLPAIDQQHCDKLYAYIAGFIKNKKSFLYIINGIDNHIHILCDIHPSISLADFLRDLKVSSSIWMKASDLFPKFNGWCDGYGAFTCSYKNLDQIIEYIDNQKEHHNKIDFSDEYREMLSEAGLEVDYRYFP